MRKISDVMKIILCFVDAIGSIIRNKSSSLIQSSSSLISQADLMCPGHSIYYCRTMHPYMHIPPIYSTLSKRTLRDAPDLTEADFPTLIIVSTSLLFHLPLSTDRDIWTCNAALSTTHTST